MPIKPCAIYELAPDGRVMLEMQDVMDMVADFRRLEFLADTGWMVLKTKSSYRVVNEGRTIIFDKKHNWRDAIDEAMKDDQ